MKRLLFAVVMLLSGVTAYGAPPPCDSDLPHVLNVGIPRTSLEGEEPAQLAAKIEDVLSGIYSDACHKGLQLNFAFGSDYEILDWLEQGSIDAAIVPNLSLWLLNTRDAIALRELNGEASSRISILRPVAPAPSCLRYNAGHWAPCVRDALATFDALIADIAVGRANGTPRVMFASHLSSVGFLDPIQRAARVLEKRQRSIQGREAAWRELFERVRFAVDSPPNVDPFPYALEEEKDSTHRMVDTRNITVVSFPGEEALQRGLAVSSTDKVYSEHLVISGDAASLFTAAAFVGIPGNQPALIDSTLASLLNEDHPPRPLEVIARAAPVFGIRSFDFSLHESLRLLAQQQRSSGVQQLALVLPGGGVKAAYQSVIVDHLYRVGELRNSNVASKADKGLVVQSVLGTSGGALLGYFVSQLGAKGPFSLTKILWRPDGKTLAGTSVFGLTDLPRYFSIVWTFFVFCVFFAFFTGRHSSPFYQRSTTLHGAWRWRLLALFVVFVSVPILIRFVTRGEEIEHVPVVEGLFYSILTILVMFGDQCLVYKPNCDPQQRPIRRYIYVVAVLGFILVFGSLSGIWSEELQRPITFDFAFVTLLGIFLGCPLALLSVCGKHGDLRNRILAILLSVGAVLVLFAFGLQGLLPEQVPHVLALLVLLILAFVVYWYAKQTLRNRSLAALLMFLTVLSTAVLCRTYDAGVHPTFHASLSFLRATALEGTTVAPFLASTGCLLLVIAAMAWVYQSPTYTLQEDEGFARAIILLIAQAFLTAMLMFGATRLWPKVVHNLEMTPSFWIALTVIAGFVVELLESCARSCDLRIDGVAFVPCRVQRWCAGRSRWRSDEGWLVLVVSGECSFVLPQRVFELLLPFPG